MLMIQYVDLVIPGPSALIVSYLLRRLIFAFLHATRLITYLPYVHTSRHSLCITDFTDFHTLPPLPLFVLHLFMFVFTK